MNVHSQRGWLQRAAAENRQQTPCVRTGCLAQDCGPGKCRVISSPERKKKRRPVAALQRSGTRPWTGGPFSRVAICQHVSDICMSPISLPGTEAVPVDVEVDVSQAVMPETIPVGLPKAASFDLPITLGVLAGSGQLASGRFEQYAVVGELSLEGRTRPTKGALVIAVAGIITCSCSARQGLAKPRTYHNTLPSILPPHLSGTPVSKRESFFPFQLSWDSCVGAVLLLSRSRHPAQRMKDRHVLSYASGCLAPFAVGYWHDTGDSR